MAPKPEDGGGCRLPPKTFMRLCCTLQLIVAFASFAVFIDTNFLSYISIPGTDGHPLFGDKWNKTQGPEEFGNEGMENMLCGNLKRQRLFVMGGCVYGGFLLTYAALQWNKWLPQESSCHRFVTVIFLFAASLNILWLTVPVLVLTSRVLMYFIDIQCGSTEGCETTDFYLKCGAIIAIPIVPLVVLLSYLSCRIADCAGYLVNREWNEGGAQSMQMNVYEEARKDENPYSAYTSGSWRPCQHRSPVTEEPRGHPVEIMNLHGSHHSVCRHSPHGSPDRPQFATMQEFMTLEDITHLHNSGNTNEYDYIQPVITRQRSLHRNPSISRCQQTPAMSRQFAGQGFRMGGSRRNYGSSLALPFAGPIRFEEL